MKSKHAVTPVLIGLAILTSLSLSACGRFPFISPPTAFPSYQSSGMPPLITSPDQAIFIIGETGTFTISGSGVPLPDIVITGNLPEGLSLSPIDNGQSILSGIPTSGTAGSTSLAIEARNGYLPDADQTLKIQVLKAKPTVNVEFPAQGFEIGTASRITVTVTSKQPLQSPPTGSVTLWIDQRPTITSLLVDGRAMIDSSFLEVGAHSLQADYSGDQTFDSHTSPAVDLVVAEQPTSLYLPVITRP